MWNFVSKLGERLWFCISLDEYSSKIEDSVNVHMDGGKFRNLEMVRIIESFTALYCECSSSEVRRIWPKYSETCNSMHHIWQLCYGQIWFIGQ